MSYLIRPVKTSQDRVTLVFTDAGPRIFNPQDGFAVAGKQFDLHPPAGRGKFDGVVDEIGDRLDEQVPVAIRASFMRRADSNSDVFVSAFGSPQVAPVGDEIGQCDVAETCRLLIFLDFRKAQNGGNDRKRLIEKNQRSAGFGKVALADLI